jgi:flagellar capping protein FliD
MQNDGSLSLDTSALNQAITANPTMVQTFLQGSSLNGFASTVSNQLKAFGEPSSGSLASDMNSLTQQYNQLQSNINDYENGYIASQRTVLNSMYSKAEIALQQLPTTMKQLQAQLGQNGSDS